MKTKKNQKNNNIKKFFFLTFGTVLLTFLLLLVAINIKSQEQNDSYFRYLVDQSQMRKDACEGVESKTGGVDITSSERKNAEKSQEAMKKMRSKNIAQQMIAGNASDAVPDIVKLIAIWIIFAILSLLGWLCYCCCCCCHCCCPPCKKCRRDVNAQPFTKIEMLWPAIGVLVFGIWIFIASAVGLSKAPKLEEGLNKMRCAVISIFDDFVHGSMLSDWKGLAGFKENLKNQETALTSVGADLNTSIVTNPDISLDASGQTQITNIAAVKAAILELQTNNPDSAGLSYVSGNYIYNFNPEVGNNTLENSVFLNGIYKQYLTDLDQGTSVIENVIQQNYTYLWGLASAYVQGLSAFTDAIKSSYSTLDDLISTGDDFSKLIFDATSKIPIITQVIKAYFAVSLSLAILCVLVVILISFLKFYKLRVVLHISWNIFTLWMLIGFILSAVLSPVSVISNDVCELLHDTLNNKNSENTLFPKKSSSTNSSEDNGMSGYIQTCKKELGGNGEILSKLNLLDTLNNLSFILPTMEVLLNSTYQQQVDTLFISSNYDGLNAAVDSVLNTGSYDGTNANVDHPNAFTSLDVLNKLSDEGYTGAGVITFCALDYFVNFVYFTCPAGYTSQGSPVSTTSINGGGANKYCFTVGSKIDNTTGFSSGGTDFCASNSTYRDAVNVNLKKYASFSTGQHDTYSLIKIQSDLISTYGGSWKTTEGSARPAVQTFYDNHAADLTGFGDKLMSGMNCLFVGENLDLIEDSFCISTLPTIYNLFVTLVVTSFGMFCFSFFLFKIGMRYAMQTEVKPQDNNAKAQGQVIPNTFQPNQGNQ